MKKSMLLEALGLLDFAGGSQGIGGYGETCRIDGKKIYAPGTCGTVVVELPEDTGLKCDVNFRILRGVLEAAEGEDVSLGVDKDALKISCGGSQGKVSLSPSFGEDIIKGLDKHFGLQGFRSVGDKLVEGLKFCLPAVSSDETRLAITGILMRSDGYLIATDGFRLARFSVGKDATGADVILPASLAKKFIGQDGELGWYHDSGSRAVFLRAKLPSGVVAIFSCVEVAGKFPPTDHFFEELAKFEEELVLSDEVLDVISHHDALQNAGRVFSVDKQIKMRFEGSKVEISSNVEGIYQLHNTVQIDGNVSKPFSIGINPSFLERAVVDARKMKFSPGARFVGFIGDGCEYIVVVSYEER